MIEILLAGFVATFAGFVFFGGLTYGIRYVDQQLQYRSILKSDEPIIAPSSTSSELRTGDASR
jgi:hypothetical protein